MCIRDSLKTTFIENNLLREKIIYLNNLNAIEDNYFSQNFGSTYFTINNARKIGLIREKIEIISDNEAEKYALITSLLYAVDKVANTVGHYDAFRSNLDTIKEIKLLLPNIQTEINFNNKVFRQDANILLEKINCDVLYIDPPYNSRQYCDAYHLLENLSAWDKPEVFGKAKKMNRDHIKSKYCLKNATIVFEDLINKANCNHILFSYNNTAESKDSRSNSRINDQDILRILNNKGKVDIFESEYKSFTTGKSSGYGNYERIFYCRVN